MTIYDIAKEAGVSASTVSRVINNKSGIKLQTREHVLALLQKYNYCPNETARGLVNQSTKIIGILVADIRHAHHTEGAYLIERELSAQGYCCIIFNTGTEQQAKAKYIRILQQRRVEGAVFIGSSFQCTLVKQQIELHLSNLPVIMANGHLDLPNIYSVLVDEQEGVGNCVDMLFSMGRKKLAFIHDELTPSCVTKIIGLEDRMRANDLWHNTPLIRQTTLTIQGGYDCTAKLLDEQQDIDGIIYAADALAAGGVRALIDRGIEIPKQISVIGIDNSIYSEICRPKLTSLDNKIEEMSYLCAKILTKKLEGKEIEKKTVLHSSIIEREST